MSQSSVAYPPSAHDYEDDALVYRALSSQATVSLTLGVLGVLAWLHWVLGLIPAAGIVLGITAIASIRRNHQELTGEGLARIGILLSTISLVGSWSWFSYVYATEVPEGYERITFGQLLTPKENPSQPPAEIREFEGQQVFIKGYIRPGSHTEATKSFFLVRDNQECCFGVNLPVPGDMILVTMAGDETSDFSLRLRRVGGKLKIQWYPYSGTGILYHLEADYIR